MVLDTQAGGGVRMEAELVTEEEVIAAVDADPRLATQRDRCEVYRRLARWGRAFGAERYARAGARGCVDYPLAAYPWRDDADVAAGG